MFAINKAVSLANALILRVGFLINGRLATCEDQNWGDESGVQLRLMQLTRRDRIAAPTAA